MLFGIDIKNLGCIAEASLGVNKLTIFAGRNNTGKSFVSKTLYSVFDAMNANVGDVYFGVATRKIRSALRDLRRFSDKEGIKGHYDNVERQLTLLNQTLSTAFGRSMIDVGNSYDETEIGEICASIADSCDAISSVINQTFMDAMAEAVPSRPSLGRIVAHAKESYARGSARGRLEIIAERLEAAKETLMATDWDKGAVMMRGLQYQMKINIRDNFQIESAKSLIREKSPEASVAILSPLRHVIGQIAIGEEDGFSVVGIGAESFDLLQGYSRVIYLESPIYWKMKNAMVNMRMAPSRFRDGERLTGAPQYLYDIVQAFNDRLIGESALKAYVEKIWEMINGRLVISETDEILYLQKDRDVAIPLSITSTGVSNVGMLGLLLEKNVIKEDAVLFIDEPEAHLHPEWQVKMARVLYRLAKGGVNVVIATHSKEFVKYFDIMLKEDEEAKDIIAVNHFTGEAAEHDPEDPEKTISAIMEDLATPFSELYLRSL